MVWIKPFYLTLDGSRVNLAHVRSPVLGLNVAQCQRPSVLVVVSDVKTIIVGDHMVMNRKNGFRVRLDPGNLSKIF